MTVISIADRFWSKVDQRDPDECWPWLAYIDPTKGYGQIGRGRRRDGIAESHRVAYELSKGPIPEGMQVDHTCHNDTECLGGQECEHRACCNPAHLEAVTQQENIARGNAGDYQKLKTHCPSGHEYSPDNTIPTQGGKHRACRVCMRASQRKYNLKRKAA